MRDKLKGNMKTFRFFKINLICLQFPLKLLTNKSFGKKPHIYGEKHNKVKYVLPIFFQESSQLVPFPAWPPLLFLQILLHGQVLPSCNICTCVQEIMLGPLTVQSHSQEIPVVLHHGFKLFVTQHLILV